MNHSPRKEQASDIIENVIRNHAQDTISLAELKSLLHERGFGLVVMIFSLPLCLPIPVPPGYTIVFSVPLLFFAAQMMWGMDSPWFPQWIARRQVKREFLAKLVEFTARYLRKIEIFLHPRWSFASTRAGEKVVGYFFFVFAVCIALPIPFANFLPGLGMAVASLGLLSKDGFYVMMGILIGVLGIVAATLVVMVGEQFVAELYQMIF